MLKDNISNINNYNTLDKNLLIGLNYLANTDFSKLNDGRYDINNDIYVNIQSYQTKQSADFEAHKKYIDIQYIIQGEENIGVCDIADCITTIPYNTDKDIEFLKGNDNFISLIKNEFMILYPNDAHKPSISINKNMPETVRKAVVKVKI